MEFMQGQPQEQQEEDQPTQNMWDEKQFLEVLKHYSEDEIVPKDIRSREWAVFGKALINTFLEKEDLLLIDIYAQILRIDEMWSKPSNRMTFKEVGNLDKMEIYMFLTAKRAIGINKNKINERTMQNTQILQNISMQGMANKPKKERSWLPW